MTTTETQRLALALGGDAAAIARTAKAALDGSADDARSRIHQLLHRLAGTRLGLYPAGSDRDPALFAVEQVLIDAFLDHHRRRTDVPAAPPPGTDFVAWYTAAVQPLEAMPHPIFAFLEREATEAQYRDFLAQDLAVHVRFDDVLAMLMVGKHGAARAEILENLRDELGTVSAKTTGGSPSHMNMLDDLSQSMRLDTRPTEGTRWQALAAANAMIVLCQYQSLFAEAAGYLGCLEALTPGRFRALGRAGIRFGMNEQATRYYMEHAEADPHHASGWLDNVITPMAREDAALASRVIDGVRLRLSVSRDFWDAELARLTDGATRRSA